MHVFKGRNGKKKCVRIFCTVMFIKTGSGAININISPILSLSLSDMGPLLRGDEIKWNKNPIKNYYHLTAISQEVAVTSWLISHLVLTMV